jgi:hypothetical protein
VAPAPPGSDTTSAYQPPPLTSPPNYVAIKAGFIFGGSQFGTFIPLGSTIYHWKNKITEAIGPDNSVLLICKDQDAAQIPTPGAGSQPATNIYQVPNGARISPDPNNKNITQIYTGNDVIGTIVNKPEDFPYASTQIRNTDWQYTAMGTYANGTSRDITSQVTWNSSDTAVAAISSSGLVTASANGTTVITASLSGVTSVPVDLSVHTLSSISVTTWNGIGMPRTLTSLSVGSTWQVYATGTYSDGSTADIKSEVNWLSADQSVATIDSSGLITGIAAGIDKVTASLYGITSPEIAFAVVSLSSVELKAFTQMTVGSKVWISAIGVYSDGSTDGVHFQVTWNSSNTAVATVSNDGLVTAVSEGTTNLTASLGNGMISKPTILTVVAAVPSPTSAP